MTFKFARFTLLLEAYETSKKEVFHVYQLVRVFKIDSHYTARHDKIFLYGFARNHVSRSPTGN